MDTNVTSVQTPASSRKDPTPSPQPASPIARRGPGTAVKRALGLAVLMALVVGGYLAWQHFRPKGLGDAFASGNGRLEAQELDISAKSAGRISEILVREGDFVDAGQIVARMDTNVLQAQLQQAHADEAQARNAVATALAQVRQRQSERAAAQAVVSQRQAEQVVAQTTAERTRVLMQQKAASVQEYENDNAQQKGTAAAVLSAKAQVASGDAAITAARSQVLEAQSKVKAAIATEKRVQADIDDTQLRTATAGRIQFRVAQPGEVVGAGGRVLSMVDLSDVSMTFFLPSAVAGRVAIGSEVHIVLDAAPQFVIPAAVTFVANVAQFTPKTVETESERQKLVFRVRAHISPDLLRQHITQVKSGLPGMAYVRLDPNVPWPPNLQTRITP
ncbi:MAG TPA: HlyD family efflux transporter periplasmic adaptor subunit [Pseudacidobacterium sp.]|nr:HlyD family efflux transporter periplasmic adaptor subunit [Pseudacidobacterium sp.]